MFSQPKCRNSYKSSFISVFTELFRQVENQFANLFSQTGPILTTMNRRPEIFNPFGTRVGEKNETQKSEESDSSTSVEIIRPRPVFFSRPSLFGGHPFFGQNRPFLFPSLFGNEGSNGTEEIPKNSTKTVSETKIVNGQEVQVNKTTHHFSNGNGNFQSFFQVSFNGWEMKAKKNFRVYIIKQ